MKELLYDTGIDHRPQIGDRVTIIEPLDDKYKGMYWWYVGDVHFGARVDTAVMNINDVVLLLPIEKLCVSYVGDYHRTAQLRQCFNKHCHYILRNL